MPAFARVPGNNIFYVIYVFGGKVSAAVGEFGFHCLMYSILRKGKRFFHFFSSFFWYNKTMTDIDVEKLSSGELHGLFIFADSIVSELKKRGLN